MRCGYPAAVSINSRLCLPRSRDRHQYQRKDSSSRPQQCSRQIDANQSRHQRSIPRGLQPMVQWYNHEERTQPVHHQHSSTDKHDPRFFECSRRIARMMPDNRCQKKQRCRYRLSEHHRGHDPCDAPSMNTRGFAKRCSGRNQREHRIMHQLHTPAQPGHEAGSKGMHEQYENHHLQAYCAASVGTTLLP